MLRAGVAQISPDVTSGDLSAPSIAGTKIDVRSNTQPGGGITWMWTDYVSIDLPLSSPFKHEIVGDGAIAGVGKIGEVKALPMTLLAQYRFCEALCDFRPYLGIGPTYARFYKARGTAALTALTGGLPSNPTTVTVDSKWGVTAQAGLAWRLGGRWQLDGFVAKTALKTRATLSTGQSIDTKLDPWTYSLAVGYRF